MRIHQHSQNTSRARRIGIRPIILALALGAVPAATVAASPGASATVCEAQWGSTKKARTGHTGKQVVDVRSGRHQCFDRLVVDLNGDGPGRPGYQVKYVKKVAYGGSGDEVPLRGGKALRIIVRAPAYDSEGNPTYVPDDPAELVDVGGYQTFRQVAWAGSYEGQTTIGVGVRARLPMRAFVLRGPDGGRRLVLDVAHHWY